MANRYWVGGTGTWDGTSTANWSATSGGAAGATTPTSADTVNFDSLSGTGTCTTASTATCSSCNFSSSTLGLTLGANLTMTGAFTLTTGTISLVSYTLSCGTFNSYVTNVRSVAFGTGILKITGTGNIWNTSSPANFSYTGTPTVNIANNSATAAAIYTGAMTAAQALNFSFTTGSYALTEGSSPSIYKNLSYTGFTGTVFNVARTIYGDLTLASGATNSAGTNAITFAGTSGIQKVTTNTVTMDYPLTQNGVGGTVQLQDNLTMGSTRTYTLTNGALDLNNLVLSTGLFASTNSNTRVIAFGTGNITTTGVGTVWNTASTTGFSYTGTPTVNISNNSATATTVNTGAMIEARALNFNYTTGTYTLTDTSAVYKSVNFTGFTGTIPNAVRIIYGGATFSAGMTLTAGANTTTFAATSGTNNITTAAKTLDFPITFFGLGGTFAFQDALTQGATRAFTFTAGTVQFKASATSTTGVFATSGASQKFLQSTTPGTQATLSQASGTVDVSHLTIQDNAAVGGATFNAYVDQGNIDAGNVDGWDFGISPIVGGAEYTYSMRSFTQSRRF